MTNEQIEAELAICATATPEPWCVGWSGMNLDIGYAGDEHRWATEADGIFVNHARTDYPVALSELKAARADLGVAMILIGNRDAEIAELRAALATLCDAAHYPENGVHYCRTCDAGTANGWRHSETCAIANQSKRLDGALQIARKALGKDQP